MIIKMNVQDVRNVIKFASSVAQLNREGAYMFLKIDVEHGTITASNERVSYVQKINLSCDKDKGAILVEGVKFNALIQSFDPELTAVLSLKKEKLELKCGRSRFKLGTIPVEDFAIGVLKGDKSIVKIHQNHLFPILENVSLYSAKDDPRPALNGVLIALEPESKKVDFVATNGHFLSLVQSDDVDFLSGTFGNGQFILSQSLIKMVPTLSSGDGFISIEFYQNYALFSDGENVLWGRLIDYVFPLYHSLTKLIDPSCDDQFKTVSSENLKGSLRRISPLLGKSGKVTLKPQEEGTIIHTPSSDIDVGYDEIDLKLPFDGEVSLNSKYLLTILKTNQGDDLNIAKQKKAEVLHFKQQTDYGLSYQLLMLMRV